MASVPRERKLVLVVDDLLEQRDIICTLLRHHGYEVVEAMDGQSGVRLATELTPDLVLMDVVLPVLDGYSATRRLKGAAVTRTIPIIIITARVLAPGPEESRHAGADAFLPKPCEPRDLLALVQRLIGPPR
jgi:two-component system, cell cycle response regulator DivK